jgi:long-chain acyl-CoA synthetase
VVPNVETIKTWAIANNIPGTLTVLCNHPEIKHLIMSDMIALGKDAGLKSFEQVC